MHRSYYPYFILYIYIYIFIYYFIYFFFKLKKIIYKKKLVLNLLYIYIHIYTYISDVLIETLKKIFLLSNYYVNVKKVQIFTHILSITSRVTTSHSGICNICIQVRFIGIVSSHNYTGLYLAYFEYHTYLFVSLRTSYTNLCHIHDNFDLYFI